MYLNRTLLLCVGLLWLCSCNPDPEEYFLEPKDKRCGDIEIPGFTGGYEINYNSEDYFDPSANPGNINEFAYFHQDNENSLTELRIFNVQSGESEVFPVAASEVDWGPDSWIVFTRNSHIWKIKSNGDSLIQLTNEGSNADPMWNESGTQILFRNSADHSLGLLYTMNPDGSEVTVVSESEALLEGTWLNEDKVIYKGFIGDQEYIGVYHMNTDVTEIIRILKNQTSIEDITWVPNTSTVIFLSSKGMYSMNSENGKCKLLRESCFGHGYSSPSISGGTKSEVKIVVQRQDVSYVDNQNVYSEIGIVMMDVNGKNEELVLF